MIKIRIEGTAALSKELASMSKRVGRAVLREALVAGGSQMQAVASSNAPREPGAPDLADNIGISNTRPEGGGVGIAIGPTQRVFYGYFQEFGTVHHASHPFMRPAFDSEQRRTTQIISGALWRAIIARGGVSARGSGGGLGETFAPDGPAPISGGPGGALL